MLAATGVSLNVLGEENLTAQRPAVFIFNHRNQVDPFIAGALVRDNFTSVGKKELEKDPIAGTLGKLMDAAFIDRDNPKAAIEQLKKIEELARKGLSIMVAPEGTRIDTTEVGPFKKGPFRMAMSAGIPIVPIVIRNAEVDRRPQFEHLQSRHRRCRGVSTDSGRRLDPRQSARPHRRGSPALPRHAQELAAGQAARGRSVRRPKTTAKKRAKKAAAKKAPAKKAAAQEGTGQEDRRAKKTPRRRRRPKTSSKKTVAKKAVAKSNTAATASRKTGAKGRP